MCAVWGLLLANVSALLAQSSIRLEFIADLEIPTGTEFADLGSVQAQLGESSSGPATPRTEDGTLFVSSEGCA